MPPKFMRNVPREDRRTADNDEKENLLEHSSDPDEDMLFNRSSTSSGELREDNKVNSVRIQIQEVTDVMRQNVQKVIERGDRLEDLQIASERLSIAGTEFRDAAKKAHQRAWMQNVKARIVVGGITLTIILCIIVLDIMVLYLMVKK